MQLIKTADELALSTTEVAAIGRILPVVAERATRLTGTLK